MVISQGSIHWADYGPPAGSGPGYRRPVIVVQCDSFNRSRIATVVCVPVTGNLRRADAPGNVLLSPDCTGLPRDSVANVSQVAALDRRALGDVIGKLDDARLGLVLAGIDVVLGR